MFDKEKLDIYNTYIEKGDIMSIWLLMFLCCLLFPLIMFVSGFFMNKKPPKRINSLVGYRTKRSMYNQATWDFANKYCGRLFLYISFIELIITVASFLLCIHRTDKVILIVSGVLMVVFFAFIMATIIFIEHKLKTMFIEEENYENQ